MFKRTQTGFITIRNIILVLIAIAVLSYFNFDIKTFIESDAFQNNFQYVWKWTKYVWVAYLSGPFNYFWNNIFIDLIWDSFLINLQRIKDGQPTTLLENSGWLQWGRN